MTQDFSFKLDDRLAADTLPVVSLGLCSLRLMNDCRWPWLILVPQRNAICEIYQLEPLDQTMLTFEMAQISKLLAKMTSCHKLNIAAIGNVVPQLHLHVVARNQGDANWPRPVWGFDGKTPYSHDAAEQFIGKLRAGL